MNPRIFNLEAKVILKEFQIFKRQLTINNIQKKGAMGAREEIMSNLPPGFADINFTANYMGAQDKYIVIHIIFPDNDSKNILKKLMQENKVGSLLKIYTNDFIHK